MTPGYERELTAAIRTLHDVAFEVDGLSLSPEQREELQQKLEEVGHHAELAVHLALGFAEGFLLVPAELDLRELKEQAIRSRAKTVEPPAYFGVMVPGNVLLALIERAEKAGGPA